MVVEKQLKK